MREGGREREVEETEIEGGKIRGNRWRERERERVEGGIIVSLDTFPRMASTL